MLFLFNLKNFTEISCTIGPLKMNSFSSLGVKLSLFDLPFFEYFLWVEFWVNYVVLYLTLQRYNFIFFMLPLFPVRSHLLFAFILHTLSPLHPSGYFYRFALYLLFLAVGLVYAYASIILDLYCIELTEHLESVS